MLSGATGQVYGSHYTCRLDEGWQANLDTPGAIELGYMKDLFISRKWYDLIPDQSHTIVTAGYHGSRGIYRKTLDQFWGPFGVGRLFAFVKRFTGLGSLTANTYARRPRHSTER